MRRFALVAVLAALAGTASRAQDAVTYPYDGTFEDAAFGVENAIVGRGMVIDYTSHVGEMLARTGPDVGSDVTLFGKADIYLFCSAVVSRQVMEADWQNIAFCPYGVFVAERDGAVTVGYRTYPDGPMDAVEGLLDEIAREAAGQ